MDGSEESEEHAHVLLQAKGSARDVVMSRWEWEEFGGPAASDMLWLLSMFYTSYSLQGLGWAGVDDCWCIYGWASASHGHWKRGYCHTYRAAEPKLKTPALWLKILCCFLVCSELDSSLRLHPRFLKHSARYAVSWWLISSLEIRNRASPRDVI